VAVVVVQGELEAVEDATGFEHLGRGRIARRAQGGDDAVEGEGARRGESVEQRAVGCERRSEEIRDQLAER